ncbi:MAG: hypothetical protein B7Y15_10000 [Bacteroidetes bacterium 24-39-8]|nr:MAG: hypothetical protein B7Y69_06680 [Sphingobacteriia bacterium 35-40-8]OYZ49715.1 MAG: hypothetical protein B7Y15_10000 [Bacteroidetes bacterium 24-39-8]
MWLYWLLTPKKEFAVAIIDKTVLNNRNQEHRSLIWILQHEKLVKQNKEFYIGSQDYFGFFPGDSGKYRIKGLERFNELKLNQLVSDCDMVYVTDTYGVYTQEWHHLAVLGDRSSLIYGGLSEQDLYFLKAMKAAEKLVIAESNTIGSPTTEIVRNQFEKSFGVSWSHWNGRYFSSFDTLKNPELPRWLYRNYMQQHGGSWPFKNAGIAFVNLNDQVVVLEKEQHLGIKDFPKIISSKPAQQHYGLPANMDYNYWFEIMVVDSSANEVLADFELPVSKSGKHLLDSIGIPTKFPAVIHSLNQKQPFFYLAGDFCDNPVNMKTIHFAGTDYFKWMLYNKEDSMERIYFFYNFYRPLISTIIKDYQKAKQ